MSKFNINHNGLVIGQCIGDNQQIVQSFGKNKIEATLVSSDHTVPSPLFSMTGVEMAQKLVDLLEADRCTILRSIPEKCGCCEDTEVMSVEELAAMLEKFFD